MPDSGSVPTVCFVPLAVALSKTATGLLATAIHLGSQQIPIKVSVPGISP